MRRRTGSTASSGEPLGKKMFGVFDCDKAADHPLVDGPARWCVPHSRCNEVPEEALRRAGYRILSRSRRGRGRHVHQSSATASSSSCKATRNTMRRRCSANTGATCGGSSPARSRDYPELPHGYFTDDGDSRAAGVPRAGGAAARHRAARTVPRRRASAGNLTAPWRDAATRLYSNWLTYLRAAHGAPSRRSRPVPPALPRRQHRPTPSHDRRLAPRSCRSQPARRCFPAAPSASSCDDRLTQALLAAAEPRRGGLGRPDPRPRSLQARVGRVRFRAAAPLDGLLSWTVAQLEPGVTQMTHPRYFGLFNPAPTFPGAMRRPHRRRVQPAAGDRDDLARRGRDRGACDPRGRAPRRAAGRDRRPFHHRRRRGQLHRADLRADPGEPGFRRSRRRAFAGAAGVLRLDAKAISPGSRSRIRPGSAAPRCASSRPTAPAASTRSALARTIEPDRAGRRRAGDAGRDRRHHQCRHDRSARRDCADDRPALRVVAACRRRLGRGADRVGPISRRARRDRAGRLADHRRA